MKEMRKKAETRGGSSDDLVMKFKEHESFPGKLSSRPVSVGVSVKLFPPVFWGKMFGVSKNGQKVRGEWKKMSGNML
jgi:hypothetical protein